MELTIGPMCKIFLLGNAWPVSYLSAVDSIEVRDSGPALSEGISPDTVWRSVSMGAFRNRNVGCPYGHPREADDDSMV